MSTIVVVTTAPGLARERASELYSLVHELGGEIDSSIMYQDNTLEFNVDIPDNKVDLLLARLSASGRFRRKEHVRLIKTLMRADGKARVLILLRDDGFYIFQAEYYCEDEGYTCWLGTSAIPSGSFDSAVKAEREAIACVPWLKRQVG